MIYPSESAELLLSYPMLVVMNSNGNEHVINGMPRIFSTHLHVCKKIRLCVCVCN